MPPLAEQYAQLQGFTALFTVLRLLTPLKMSYEAANKCTESYTKIVEELPQMRREAVHLVRQAVSEARRAYVPHQQSSEGNAAKTEQGLSEMLRARLSFRSFSEPMSVDPEDVGMMDWSGSDDLKGITGVSGNQFTAGSTVIVVRQIIVVVVFQFQVQMLTRSMLSLCPLHA
ncbi:MAG: hypothetical protein ABIQ24_11545 [Nitrospiraceae bacterium]